jgi:hypothetical protein
LGGFGSGGTNWKRAHLEGHRRIGVHYLRKQDLMRPGIYASLRWTNNLGEPTGSIQVAGGEHFVTLIYSVRRTHTEAWRPIQEQVAFARVAKPFGGEQVYFFCPRCGRRVLELALGAERFRCRTCLGLVHASSQESPTDRAMRRANKLKRRLGAEPGLDSWYTRPKHMRRKTFDKIEARIRAAEAEVNDAHIRLLGRLSRFDQRRSGRRPVGRRAAARGVFW